MNNANQDTDRPNFPACYFWDFIYSEIEWRVSYKTVIARMLERGNEEDWEELCRFYGRDTVVNAIKSEIVFLADYAIEDVERYFHIPKETMLCFNRKKSRSGYWI